MSSSSDPDIATKRDALLGSWQYIASPDFASYAHWESINATSNELRDTDGNSATIVIVGKVVSDKLAVDPLGNFQSQEERQQRYQDSETRNKSCLNAKQVIILRSPKSSLWKTDYKTATTRLDALQEKVAKKDAPRQHLLDKDHDPPFVRVTFPLWYKKKYQTGDQYLDDTIEEEDDVVRALREDHDVQAKKTAQYISYVPDSCTEAFRGAAKTHHIRHIPVFMPNGKLVPLKELLIRLEDAVVEVMFSLKHYYYGPTSTGRYKQTNVGNTFTATIEQVKILQVNTVAPSPLREPAMKTIQLTPPTTKGKAPMSTKRASSQPPLEDSPSQSKKIRTEEPDASHSSSPTETGSRNGGDIH